MNYKSLADYLYRFARGLKVADHSAQDVYFDLWQDFDGGDDISSELLHEIKLCIDAGEVDHVQTMLRLLLESEQELLGITSTNKTNVYDIEVLSHNEFGRIFRWHCPDCHAVLVDYQSGKSQLSCKCGEWDVELAARRTP